MYCPVVIMSPLFIFEIKGKHRSKGVLCLQQSCILLDCCKSSANGYEQCRRQIQVHENLLLSSVLQFVSHIVVKIVILVGATECNTRGIVCKHNYNFLRSARNLDCYASFVVDVSLLNEPIHGVHNVCDGGV